MTEAVNLFELEALAERCLPKAAFDYYISAANDEITLRENRSAYERIRLAPRMLVDVSSRDMSTNVLGANISMPILVAPTAFQRMAHRDGEVATARAAACAGTIMTLSTLSNSSIEEVADGARRALQCNAPTTVPQPSDVGALHCSAQPNLWFQLYVYKDRGITKSLVERAEAAGYAAIALTVDAPLLGRRERDVRNRFCLPENLSVKNLFEAGLNELPSDIADSGLAAYIASLCEPALTWKDLEWLKNITRLPILLKGVLRADDAIKAVKSGADGIIVSNHGGRQLDTVPATIDALPLIVQAVGHHTTILIDGGIRRGTDVLKAIAYGARAVLIGRPVLWGLAMDGERGVQLVLELLRQELDLAMALSGCKTLQDITPDLIFTTR